jgi:hypothetical protein
MTKALVTLLGLLVVILLAKAAAFLHRQKVLGITMIIAGGAIVSLALYSSEYPDLKEAEIGDLWLYGIGGATACLAGLVLAFCESSQRRLLRRMHDNCQQQPYGRH